MLIGFTRKEASVSSKRVLHPLMGRQYTILCTQQVHHKFLKRGKKPFLEFHDEKLTLYNIITMVDGNGGSWLRKIFYQVVIHFFCCLFIVLCRTNGHVTSILKGTNSSIQF